MLQRLASYYTACNTHTWYILHTYHRLARLLHASMRSRHHFMQAAYLPRPLRSQGSKTIIMLGGLLQSRLNSLVHIFNLLQWTRTLPGELDKSMIYEPFCQQVWWQVCELKWALDDSRDFLSQVCEVWTHLRKLSKEKAEFSPNFMSLAYLKITLWSWPSRSNGCAVLWKLTDDFIRIFKRLLKSIKRYFSVALI